MKARLKSGLPIKALVACGGRVFIPSQYLEVPFGEEEAARLNENLEVIEDEPVKLSAQDKKELKELAKALEDAGAPIEGLVDEPIHDSPAIEPFPDEKKSPLVGKVVEPVRKETPGAKAPTEAPEPVEDDSAFYEEPVVKSAPPTKVPVTKSTVKPVIGTKKG